MKNKTFKTVLGGLFCALFFLSSNIIPAITIVPTVPITFQVAVIAMMTVVLGTSGALFTLLSIFAMTAVGIPMMSGFNGGIGFFVGPTAGFTIGFVFIILMIGLTRYLFQSKNLQNKPLLRSILFFVSGAIGVLLCYFSGAVGLAVYTGGGKALIPTFLSITAGFWWADGIKLVVAYLLSEAALKVVPKSFNKPLVKKMVNGEI